MTDPRQDNTDEPEETNNNIWGQPPNVNPDIITILYQNVNGFHGIDTQLRLIEEKIRPDIIGLVELNIPLTAKNREMIKEEMNNVFDASCISCAHTKDPTPSVRYKPGGTMVAALNQLVGHVIGKGGDELGRWSYITLAGTNGKRLTIMSAYRVHNNPKAGPMTYYSQLVREHERMRQSEDTEILEPIDPSAETVKALRLQLQEFQSKGHDIIVLLDANEHHQSARSSVNGENHSILNMLDSLSLVSTFSIITDDPDEIPNTHINGSKCIDFIYVSESITPFITTMSILPFGDGFHSDHRALLLQLDPSILHDYTRQDLIKPTQRLIHTNEVHRCEKYINSLLKMVQDHNVVQRLDKLITALNDEGPSEESIRKFNHLDREFGEYITAAEKQANKGATKWDWSPPLAKARLRYRYWKMRKQLKSHNLSITEKWRRLTLKTGIGDSYTHDHFIISEIDLEIKRALIDLKAVKKNHISLREQHLRDLAFKYARGNQKDEERIVKRIRYMEEQKRIFTKISNIFKGPREPLTAILAPLSDLDPDSLILTTEQQTIFNVLTNVNREKLRASIGSPFLSGNLDILGSLGFTEDATMILQGKYPTMDLTLVQQVFIEELSNQLRPIPSTFLNEGAFQNMILNTRENTSSSPSGRHYGLYRAGVQNEELLHIHAALATQPFRHGFILDRWRQVTQVMIKKKAQPIYNSLRIIEIFEGDLSAISKVIMKHIMEHLERENDTVAGTYATIRGGSTHQAIFSRVWAYDMARLQRSAIATIDNDSIGAYDRIIPQLLSILLRRMGCSDNITRTLVTQLTMKVRRIQTAYGLSDPIEVITSEGKMEYLGGIGQGHPGGPTAYHALLLPMIRVLQRLTEGYQVHDPSGKEYRQVITSYVDDCNQLVTVPRYKDKRHLARQLIKKAQHTLNIWDEVIQLSGGAISIDKSFWNVCPGWYEYRGKLLPLTVESLLPDEDVNIYCQGQIYPMREATTSERYLGVRVGITGSMTDEWDYRMKQSIAFSEVVKKIASRKEAVVAYRSYYRPKFEYPLPVTTMSKAQLDSIERPSVNALLSAMGYNRNFPRAVVFGPVAYGGIGLKSLYFQQGYLGIKWFVKTVREESRVTELLRTLVYTTQLEAGIETHILSSSVHRKRILQYLTPTWLTHLITFLEEHGLNILLDNEWNWRPNLQRQGDEYLMDIFLNKKPFYTVSELRSINRVRLFLQTYSRSCICDNQSISSHLRTAKHCHAPRAFRRSILEWPEVQPTAADWTVWRKALKYLETTKKAPLGDWIYTHQSFRPVQIETRFVLLRTRPRNMEAALHALPLYQRHALGVTWVYEDNINQFLEEFKEDGDLSLIGGSDGGYREAEDQAAHAFTVRTANEDILFEGAGPTDGYPMSSYRTELMGLFSVMVSLNAIRQLLPKRRKRVIPIEVFCDNQSSVDMINNSEEYLDPLVEEYDVISEIRSLKKRLSTWYTITVTWIKGHQSRDTGTGDPRGISINTDMDEACRLYLDKEYDIDAGRSTHNAQFMPCSKVAVAIGTRIVHKALHNELDDHINGNAIRQYLQHKYDWRNEEIDMIDWTTHGNMLEKMQMHTRPTTHKAIHGWLYTGTWQEKIHGTSPHCVLCDSREDNDHVLICKATQTERSLLLDKFRTTLQKNKTAPIIQTNIMHYLNELMHAGHTIAPIPTNPDDPIDLLAIQATNQQHQLTWQQLLKGRISLLWAQTQEAYLQLFAERSKMATGTRWAVELAEAASTLLKDIWKARNDRIHKKDEGQSMADQQIKDWVTDFYANQDILVTIEERARLFDVPLDERLNTNINLLVLWLQTVQLIANRQLPPWWRQTTARLSLYKFFNRVRPPEQEGDTLQDRDEEEDDTSIDTTTTR